MKILTLNTQNSPKRVKWNNLLNLNHFNVMIDQKGEKSYYWVKSGVTLLWKRCRLNGHLRVKRDTFTNSNIRWPKKGRFSSSKSNFRLEKLFRVKITSNRDFITFRAESLFSDKKYSTRKALLIRNIKITASEQNT